MGAILGEASMSMRPKGTRTLCALMTVLWIAGCDDIPRARTESEIEDIAADVVADMSGAKLTELESRLEEAEATVTELESDKEQLESQVADLEAKVSSMESDVDQLNARTPY